MDDNIIIVDAENQILGRMASKIAKLLLEGKKVYVVNAEKAVLSGEPKRVIEGYKKVMKVQTYRNPDRQGIRREKTPPRIIKATVRGMLPKNKPKGKNALKNLKVYIGVPSEFQNKEKIKFKEAEASKLNTSYMYLEQLSKSLGWRGSAR